MNQYIIGTNNKFYYYYSDNNSNIVDLIKNPQEAMIFSSKEMAENKIKSIISYKFHDLHKYKINTDENECLYYVKPGNFITGEEDRNFKISDFTVFIIEYLVREAP